MEGEAVADTGRGGGIDGWGGGGGHWMGWRYRWRGRRWRTPDGVAARVEGMTVMVGAMVWCASRD